MGLGHGVLRALPSLVTAPNVLIPRPLELLGSPSATTTCSFQESLCNRMCPRRVLQSLDAESWRLLCAICGVMTREQRCTGFAAVGNCPRGCVRQAIVRRRCGRSSKCRGIMQRGDFHTDGVQKGAVAGDSCKAGSSV